MQGASGSTVDVGVSGICTGIPVPLVYPWIFFTQSLSGTGSFVNERSRRTIA